MIWLTWRQFRTQAIVGGAGLAAVAVYLTFIGMSIRDTYDDVIGFGMEAARQAILERYEADLNVIGLLVLAVPALIGAFWGAPLVAREVEAGTHRLVWSQSVTRARWLAVKFGVVVLAAASITGALSALLTWAASPYDLAVGSRFDPMIFGARNIAPLGYGVFAAAAGIAIGLLLRRTVAAMAVTLAVVAALQVLMPTVVRPHLQTPVTASMAFDASETTGLNVSGDTVRAYGFTVPGAWLLSDGGRVTDSTGRPVTRAQVDACDEGGPDKTFTCLEEADLRVEAAYLPADAYWPIQWMEFAIFLGLGGLLTGVAFWRIRKS